MRKAVILFLIIAVCQTGLCQKVTVRATDVPAEAVFRNIMDQTGKNFVYSPDILDGVKVTVDIRNTDLKQALKRIFNDSGIEYKVKGSSIILKKGKTSKKKEASKPTLQATANLQQKVRDTLCPVMLNEVLVESRLDNHPMSTSEIGAMKLTGEEIRKAPAFLGEEDVMKTLQMQGGIISTAEGLAGISVHGGDPDQNMVMLDNVPLYNGDHCLGIFSAFNVDAIDHIDFYSASLPARYDGRLSSYLDVRTKSGSQERRNGTFRLGLAAVAFSINGPIRSKTTYSVAMKRTWSEALTLPLSGLLSLVSEDDLIFGYAFTDLNCKVSHKFSDKTKGFINVYYGADRYYVNGTFEKVPALPSERRKEKYNLKWGNMMVQSGINHMLSETMSGEFTLAYTRFFSSIHEHIRTAPASLSSYDTYFDQKTTNDIGDLIAKGDFVWRPKDNHRIGFGAGYTYHAFLPEKASMIYRQYGTTISEKDTIWCYKGHEANLYMEDDWRINDRLRLNVGLHASLFAVDGKTRSGLCPRFSMSYTPKENWAFKMAYARKVQYTHRLSQSYLSLPTDQWVPITDGFKPETADILTAGIFRTFGGGSYTVSVEGYMKGLHNIVEYKEEYYLKLPTDSWDSSLCSGEGRAKGIDVRLEKRSGRVTGHMAYSLMKADRTFPDKNGGMTYPARLDQTHGVNILANWDINENVRLSASWTGHSGNRFTLMTQTWEGLDETDQGFFFEQSPLKTNLNNYRLPFYHRLDLSCSVKNSRGYWNFSLYNAYCHMNTIGIRRSYDEKGKPVFQKIALLPIIPSASYTWIF